MSVKWIRIGTQMFEDEKIRLIDEYEESDTIIVIWLKLFLLSKKYKGIIPNFSNGIYKLEETLSILLKREIDKVEIALSVLSDLKLVSVKGNELHVNRFWLSNQEARSITEYKAWRTAVFERDSYTCQHCKVVGGELNAHHILGFAEYFDKRFDLDNGLTLCVTCHREHHRKERENG